MRTNFNIFIMKKLIYLFLAVAFTGLSLVSCSSDDDGGSPSVLGKWEYFQEGFVVGGEEVFTNYEHTAGCNKDYVQFNDNGTMQDVYYWNDGDGCVEDSDSYTYSVSGNTITTTFGSESSSGTFSISNNILKVTYTTDGITYVDTYKKM